MPTKSDIIAIVTRVTQKNSQEIQLEIDALKELPPRDPETTMLEGTLIALLELLKAQKVKEETEQYGYRGLPNIKGDKE